MSIVLNNFIIETQKKVPYFDQIVNYIESNEADILSFFHLSKLSNKYYIKIIDICEFKELLINTVYIKILILPTLIENQKP